MAYSTENKENTMIFNIKNRTKLTEAPAFYPKEFLRYKKGKNLSVENKENDYGGLAPNSSYVQVNCRLTPPSSLPESAKKTPSEMKTKRKTEICHYWEMNGTCKFGERCAFAHGEKELVSRKMSNNYKTKKCKQFFENGFCPYGIRCQFSHESEKKSGVCYINEIAITDFLNVPEMKTIFLKRPRLQTFEKIAQFSPKETEEKRLQLLDDIIEARYRFKASEESSTVGSEEFEKYYSSPVKESTDDGFGCGVERRKRFPSA